MLRSIGKQSGDFVESVGLRYCTSRHLVLLAPQLPADICYNDLHPSFQKDT